MYTTHGHHISGTEEVGAPAQTARCGGIGRCQKCTDEMVAFKQRTEGNNTPREQVGLPWSSPDEREDLVTLALSVVKDYYAIRHPNNPEPNVYVVWFSKTLQNWKAMVSTDVPDGRYFELTYNGDEDELYVDMYVKHTNTKIEYFRRDQS